MWVLCPIMITSLMELSEKMLSIDFLVDIKPSSVHGNAFLSFDDKKDAIKVGFSSEHFLIA